MRPTGSAISFHAGTGSAEAVPVGTSRKLNYRVRLVSEDGQPCPSGSPAFLDMVQSNGRILRFSASTGRVSSLISPSGVETTAEQYAAQLQVTRNPETGAVESVWSKSQGLLQTIPAGNKLTLAWFAPGQVRRNSLGLLSGMGLPWKTVTYETTEKDGVPVMLIDEQREGMPAFHSERYVKGNNVTIITGEGAERIVRTIERGFLPGDKWETIETYRRMDADGNISDDPPASCVRTVKKNTEGGWLTLSRTVGYGTPEAQTTLYTYNEQFRRTLVIEPNGSYTRYEYDERGRTTLEARPWAGGGEQAMRTTYADLRFNDFRPASETDLIIDEDGEETVLARRVYTYEDSDEVNRTTVTETALGSVNVHTSVSETNGPAAVYPYARGRERFIQGVDGRQTLIEYAPADSHGAIHMVTRTSMVNGDIVSGQSSREVEYIADNGTVTRNERYVHTGEGWSLVAAEDYEYNVELKRTRVTRANGRVSTTEWMCCGPLRETDEDGITVSYGYDTAKQLVESIRSATETTPETIVSYVRDAEDRVLEMRRDVGPMTTVESSFYDSIGRVTSTTDVLGRTTYTDYSEDLLVTTVTSPSGATFITEVYYDGTTVLRSGTGQREIETRMELTPEGILTTRLTGNVILSRQLSNGFGETLREDTPNTLGGFISTHHTYNGKGQRTRSQTEQMAPTLYEYDEMGNMVKQTLALSDTPTPLNSRITEKSQSYAVREDGIYQIQTTIAYNASGQPLVQMTETLVSSLSAILESRSRSQDIYGQVSESWSEYTAPTKRTQYAKIPTSVLIASAIVVDGFVQQSTDNTGITTTQSRSYTSSGQKVTQTDGRGNTTSTETDLAGRIIKEPDAARATITRVYDSRFDLPSCVTNALGDTTCYAYDIRGRKIAEYGTAVQPACFGYDEADRMISLTTFRIADEEITTDPSERTDGDTTRWTYEEATGRQLKKTYADGSEVIDTYDAMNRLSTRTLARGIATSYSYDPLTGETTQVHYSDETPDFTYEFNHLGQIVAITTQGEEHPYSLTYNDYGVMAAEGYWMGWQESHVKRTFDAFGRPSSSGIELQNETPIEWEQIYDECGRISSFRLLANETRGFEEKTFQFSYLPGSSLVSRIDWSNGLCLEYTYQSWRDILTGIRCGTSDKTYTIAEKTRELDPLGRPEKGLRTRLGETHDDYFSYNLRNELTGAMFGGGPVFEYAYDNIGNREQFQVRATQTDYESNELNQYSLITPSYAPAFTPTFDADGNQTRIRTTSGIWNVIYNANNRPIRFASEDNETVVECRYDHMGRRVTKKVSVGGIVTQHEGYHYLDYVQVAAVDLLANNEVLHAILWNPLESVATRPLALVRGSSIYYSAHDFVKNITEWINEQGEISVSFDYTPYGEVISETGDVSLNVIGYSSEVMDRELGLVYYNYRHLNPLDGRWISRDPIAEQGGLNLFTFVSNSIGIIIDFLGEAQINLPTPDEPIFIHPYVDPDTHLPLVGYVTQEEVNRFYKAAIELSLKRKNNKRCYQVYIHAKGLATIDDVKNKKCDIKFIIGHGCKIDGKDYVVMKDGQICINSLNSNGVQTVGFGCSIGDNKGIVPQCYAAIQLSEAIEKLVKSPDCPCKKVCIFSGPVNQ